MATQAASVDDAGQQGKVTRPPRCASAVADLPQNHPLTQGPFGFIVGQWPKRVFQNSKDRFPVIQKLDGKLMGFGWQVIAESADTHLLKVTP